MEMLLKVLEGIVTLVALTFRLDLLTSVKFTYRYKRAKQSVGVRSYCIRVPRHCETRKSPRFSGSLRISYASAISTNLLWHHQRVLRQAYDGGSHGSQHHMLAMVCADEFGYPFFDLAALDKEGLAGMLQMIAAMSAM